MSDLNLEIRSSDMPLVCWNCKQIHFILNGRHRQTPNGQYNLNFKYIIKRKFKDCVVFGVSIFSLSCFIFCQSLHRCQQSADELRLSHSPFISSIKRIDKFNKANNRMLAHIKTFTALGAPRQAHLYLVAMLSYDGRRREKQITKLIRHINKYGMNERRTKERKREICWR